jgi:hypothetical protein
MEISMEDTERLRALRVMNPEFAKAEANGERRALHHAEMVRGIDGKASRRHPERAPHEDGTPRDWCGSCLHPDGCVMCDLDESKDNLLKMWGKSVY